MKRRALLCLLGAVPAAAVVGATTTPPAPQPWTYRGPFDFEPAGSTPMDVSQAGVSAALQRLQWDTGDPERPLLVVSPADYLYAAGYHREGLRVWATPQLPEHAWFVSWRGRRVGSEGA